MRIRNPLAAVSVAITLSLGAAQAAPLVVTPAVADGASGGQLIFGLDRAGDESLLEKAQFLWAGRNYCWYPGGWHGPGYYWCGFAWRRGYGWGGGYGWHGWRGGGGGWHGGWHGGGWHGGGGGWHGGGGGGWHGGDHGGGGHGGEGHGGEHHH